MKTISNLLSLREIQTGLENGQNRTLDHKPFARLYTTIGRGQWLISELDAKKPDLAYGVFDDGQHPPELGWFSLGELESLRLLKGRCPLIERDEDFVAQYPISIYAEAAELNGRITTAPADLVKAAMSRDKHLRLNSLQGPQFA